MKRKYMATFAKEGTWTSGADSTLLVGDWQAWVDGEGHWKVRGPDPDNEAHYADGDIELTAAEDLEAGNSEARRKIRAMRAKKAARAYIQAAAQPKTSHATKKSPVMRLTAAQRAYVAAVEEDVRSQPSAFKAHVRANPGEWALQHIEGLDEDEVRRMTREQRAETKLTARLSGGGQGTATKLHHATKKSPAQLQREIDDVLASKGTSGLSVIGPHADRKSPVETKFTASIRISGAPAAMQTREFKHRVDAQTWLDQQREIADRRGWSNYRFELTEQHEVKRKRR